jgi:hypothetical protein
MAGMDFRERACDLVMSGQGKLLTEMIRADRDRAAKHREATINAAASPLWARSKRAVRREAIVWLEGIMSAQEEAMPLNQVIEEMIEGKTMLELTGQAADSDVIDTLDMVVNNLRSHNPQKLAQEGLAWYQGPAWDGAVHSGTEDLRPMIVVALGDAIEKWSDDLFVALWRETTWPQAEQPKPGRLSAEEITAAIYGDLEKHLYPLLRWFKQGTDGTEGHGNDKETEVVEDSAATPPKRQKEETRWWWW